MSASHTDTLRMHEAAGKTIEPKVETPRRSFAWVWIILVMMLVMAGCFWLYKHTENTNMAGSKRGMGGAGDRPLPVMGAVAKKGDLPVYLTGLGTVTPFYTVTIKARVDGQLDKVLFTEGQIVHTGDQLFQIDPRPYQVQLDQAKGQLEKDQSTFNNAKVNVERDQSAGDAVSKQQIDTDKTAMDQATGAMTIDQAAIDSANLNLNYCKITAPITGKIGLRLVDQGNMVHASDTSGLAVITQLQPISVVFPLPQDQLLQVQKRMKAGGTIEVEAYSRDQKTVLATGSLLAIDNQIDPNSASVKLKASFENADDILYPGQFVYVKLLVDTIKDTVTIPAAAVQQNAADNFFVYVAKKVETKESSTDASTPATTKPSPAVYEVSMQTIDKGVTESIGEAQIETTAITSGLSPGDVVITDGVDKLQDGSKVNIRFGSRAATSAPASNATTHPAGQRRGKRPGP